MDSVTRIRLHQPSGFRLVRHVVSLGTGFPPPSSALFFFALCLLFSFLCLPPLPAQDVTIGEPVTYYGFDDGQNLPPLALVSSPLPAYPEELRGTDTYSYAIARWPVTSSRDGTVRTIVAGYMNTHSEITQGACITACRKWKWDPETPAENDLRRARVAIVFNPASAPESGDTAAPRLLDVSPVVLIENGYVAESDMILLAEVTVGASGKIEKVKLPPVDETTIDRAAIVDVVKTWKIAPARKNGKPIAATIKVPVIVIPETSFPMTKKSVERDNTRRARGNSKTLTTTTSPLTTSKKTKAPPSVADRATGALPRTKIFYTPVNSDNKSGAFEFKLDNKGWLPLTDAERNATASVIDPHAGAEILHRVEQINDGKEGACIVEGHIRVKVYDDNGVQRLSIINIPYTHKNQRFRSLEARVIKPDGTIVNVEKKDIYDREILQAGNQRVRVRSFAFPSLAPGMIVEYKWRFTLDGNIGTFPLRIMSDMPARRVLLRYKPHAHTSRFVDSKAYLHLCIGLEVQHGKDGFRSVEARNVKATIEEPFMPPSINVHPWILFYTSFTGPRGGWSGISRSLFEFASELDKKGSKKESEANATLVREIAEKIAKEIDSPAARAAAINDYCRSQIRNTDYIRDPIADDAKAAEKRRERWPRAPGEIIKSKIGDSLEIQMLFIALAKALNMDAYPAFCANRNDGPFLLNIPSLSQLPDQLVAMRMDGWQFFDPARRTVDTGMLHYDNEGQTALVIVDVERTNHGKHQWLVTPASPVEKTRTHRTANLRLDEDGAIEGDIKIEFTGHDALDARARFHAESQAGLDERARQYVKAQFPNAEISGITVSTPNDFLKPFVLACTLRVPAYADRTGRRLFVQPGVFGKNNSAPFLTETRVHDIWFDSPILTEDDITIKIPSGCQVEEGSAPKTLGKTQWGRHEIKISHTPARNEIHYNRVFEFAPQRTPADQYAKIKAIFDLVQLQDAHTLSLQFDQ
jgi:hypothetical protein